MYVVFFPPIFLFLDCRDPRLDPSRQEGGGGTGETGGSTVTGSLKPGSPKLGKKYMFFVVISFLLLSMDHRLIFILTFFYVEVWNKYLLFREPLLDRTRYTLFIR